MRTSSIIPYLLDLYDGSVGAYVFVVRRHYWKHGQLRFFIWPRTFSELLKRKMLFDRRPVLTLTADKYKARSYIAERIGEDYLVPLLGVYDDPAEIPFEDLPRPYVLKANHASACTIFIRSDGDIDRTRLVSNLREWLNLDFYRRDREWAYKNIPRRIVVEKMLVQDGKSPPDYKFLLFHGKVEIISVGLQQYPHAIVQRRDRNWRVLIGNNINNQNYMGPVERPHNLEEMIRIAQLLGRDFEHVRIDLYRMGDKIYAGEVTHYHMAGNSPFTPDGFDRALGDLWRLGRPLPERFYLDQRADGATTTGAEQVDQVQGGA